MSSAVTHRERRKTAGQRMTALVGKALEEDDTFWGHDTWADDAEDSGNDSFHTSDEDSELQKDEFDSDFDDSESDHDDEERAAGMEEEARLKRAERNSKQRKNNYVDIAKAGRDLMQKKKGKGKKRVIGDGINAGIVLNGPQLQSARTVQATTPQPTRKSHTKPKSDPVASGSLANSRRRRSLYSPRRLREVRSTAPSDVVLGKSSTTTKKTKRRRYGQEELLLEAVNETEPSNERWLLARKRVQDLAEKDKESSLRSAASGKVIEKYHSRRGCLITLTFPEMDAVPEILTRPKKQLKVDPTSTVCAITGKQARYRDPLTKMGYFDVAAFKELRRRHETGEALYSPIDETQTQTMTPPRQNTIDVEMKSANPDTTFKSPGDSAVSPSHFSNTQQIQNRESTLDLSSRKTNGSLNAKTVGENATLDMVTDSSPAQSAKAKRDDPGSPPSTPRRMDVNALSALEKSPISPGRRSRRKWKPSSKLLQNIANEDRKMAAESGALTIRLETDDLAWCRSSAAANQFKERSLDSTSDEGRQDIELEDTASNNGKATTSAKRLTRSTVATPSRSATEEENRTASESNSALQSPSSQMSPGPNMTAIHAATPPGADIQEKPSEQVGVKEEISASSTANGSERHEPVYILPSENKDPPPQNGGNDEEREPRYITQNELIMEAIQTYSRQRENSFSQSDN